MLKTSSIAAPAILRTVRLLFSFYRNFLFLAWVFTLICAVLYFYNDYRIISGLFLFKGVTSGLICYFTNFYKRRELYYYRNLGMGKVFLWSATMTFDLFVFLLTLLLTSYIK